jgi:hypothetical protein
MHTPPLIEPPRIMTPGLQEPIVVSLVCVGPKYPIEYVERLLAGVRRHLPFKYTTFAITDREDVAALVDKHRPPDKELSRMIAQDGGGELWWHKVELFRPWHPVGTVVLYLDLDVIIRGDLSPLLTHSNEFVIAANWSPNRKHCAHNSSVMSWRVDQRIERLWNIDPRAMRALHGDQCWIWRALGDEVIRNFPLDWVQSYKYHYRTRKMSSDCRVLVFHGDPKPHAVTEPELRKLWQEN